MAFRRRLAADDGFTLIELMVVVLILGILIGIAVPTFLGAVGRAHDKEAQSDLRNAATASKVFFVDDDTYSGLTPVVAGAVEPSLIWGPAGDPGAVEHVAIVIATGWDLLLVRRSNTGRYFCVSDQLNSPAYSTGNGDTYSDVDTQAECQNGW